MSSELTGVSQPLQQNSQATPTPSTTSGATGAINTTADSVVTQTAKTDQPDVGKDDAHRREASKASSLRQTITGIPRLDELAKNDVKTVVGFDVNEANHIYIRVQDSNTGQEIAQIPSKEFVQFLRLRFEELSGGSSSNNNSVSASI